MLDTIQKLNEELDQFAHTPKYHAVILFETQIEHTGHGKPACWIKTGEKIFNNGAEALEYYANTPCPASQLVSSETMEGLRDEIDQMVKNMNDNTWLEKNLYPYL